MLPAIWLPFALTNRHGWNGNSNRPVMRVMYVDCDCGNVFLMMIAFVPVTDYAAYDVSYSNWMMMPMGPVYALTTMMWSNHTFR